jgi:dihydroorotase
MSTLLIKRGHIIDPANRRDMIGDILVVDGKIKKVGKGIREKADDVIDARGLIVTPGLVDMHVHLREPGREDQETILTASRAALSGGVTSVAAMPNTNPIADNQAVIEFVLSRAKELGLVNVYPVGATTKKTEGDLLSEMWEMKRSGAVAVTDDGVDVADEGLLLKALEYAKTHDLLVMNHCETEELAEGGAMHEGWVSTDLGLAGIPEVAEDLAAHKSILLAVRSGARTHLTHLSTKGAVGALRIAKKAAVKNVTADVAIQHAVLTDEECRGYNTNAKMYPPLRSEDHRKAIVEALKDGTIDAITTDHAPHIEPDKLKPFADAARGTVGLETSFAALYTYLVKPKHLTLAQGIALMTYKPARILGQKKGTLAVGSDADIAIFDIKKEWKVDPSKFQSKGKNSVFAGKRLTGKAVHTIVGGRVKMRDGRVLP